MVKGFFLVMYVFVALFVLAHVPYEGGVGWQMLQAPVVWVISAGWVMVMFPPSDRPPATCPTAGCAAGVGVVWHSAPGVGKGGSGDAEPYE